MTSTGSSTSEAEPRSSSDLRRRSPSTASSSSEPKKTICAVCHVTSDNHHVHYGALVCFSCRAFFRRAHAKPSDVGLSSTSLSNKVPGYVCKKEGNCEISAKSRKKCQRCRYDKCISVGMDPKQVLNAEQKKVRFRKMLEKRGSMNFRRVKKEPCQQSSDDESLASDDNALSTASYRIRRSPDLDFRRSKSFRSVSIAGVASSSAGPSRADSDSSAELSRKRCRSNDELNKGPKSFLQYGSDEEQMKTEILAEMGIFVDDTSNNSNNPSSAAPNFSQSRQWPWYSPAEFQSTSCDLNRMYQYSYPLRSQSPLQFTNNEYIQLSQGFQCYSAPSTSPDSWMSSSGIPQVNSTFQKIKTIVEAFDFAMKNVLPPWDLVNRLIGFHRQQGQDELDELIWMPSSPMIHIQDGDFQQLADFKRRQFNAFASRIPSFLHLPESDRQTLLDVNTNLFVNFVFASYANTEDGLAQLAWILPEFAIPQAIKLPNVTIDTYLKCSGLFLRSGNTGNDVFAYGNLSAQLSQLGLSRHHLPLISAILLFTQSDESVSNQLTEHGNIAEIAEDLTSTIDTAEFRSVRISRQTIEKVLDIVSVISNLCSWTLNNKTPTSPRSTTTAKANSPEASTSTNKVEPAALDSPGCSASSVNQNLALYTPQLAEIEMGFTIEEEAWLNNQLRKFKEAYDEVSLGEEQMDEFVMFSYDVPLSKHFIPKQISTFIERSRRILKIHPEFSELSDSAQRQIWRDGCFKAAAICSVKGESFKTGTEQLRFCFGSGDERNFASKFSALNDTSNKIKKVLVTDWNRTSNALDSMELINYLQLTAKVSASVEDSFEMFVLVSLLSLLTGNQSREEESSAIKSLEKKYNMIIHRKMMSCGTDRSTSSKVRSGLDSVDELAGIFRKLHVF